MKGNQPVSRFNRDDAKIIAALSRPSTSKPAAWTEAKNPPESPDKKPDEGKKKKTKKNVDKVRIIYPINFTPTCSRKYLKKLARLTGFNDVVEIPFEDALSYYVAYKIEKRRKNTNESEYNRGLFQDIVKNNLMFFFYKSL